jgi:hypothetical protein
MTTLNSTRQSWITQEVEDKVNYYIQKYNEIPKSLKLLATNWRADNDCHVLQMWPGATQILYKAKQAFIDFSALAPKIFENHERVNIFDLYHTNGYTSLPMVISLYEKRRLGKYIPVTMSEDMAKNASNSILQTIMLSKTSNDRVLEFNTDHVQIDIEKDNFKHLLRSATADKNGEVFPDQTNVFILGENSLGNVFNPELFLKNIYDSMNSGDKLVLMQAIFRAGTEDNLVEDYIKLYPNMGKTIEMVNAISPEHSYLVNFDERSSAIAVEITVNQDSIFGNLKLQEGSQYRIFRSVRFKMNDLYKMFHNVGFSVSMVVHDDHEDNAVILLTK